MECECSGLVGRNRRFRLEDYFLHYQRFQGSCLAVVSGSTRLGFQCLEPAFAWGLTSCAEAPCVFLLLSNHL